MFNHDKVPVKHPRFTDPVPVDKDIAALIHALWMRGIDTDESCQNVGPGSVWIQFSSGRDAQRFLGLVATIRESDGPEAGDGLYYRMIGGEDGSEDGWEYEVVPWDLNMVMLDEEGVGSFDGPADIVMPVAVRFPIADYFRVLHLVMNG